MWNVGSHPICGKQKGSMKQPILIHGYHVVTTATHINVKYHTTSNHMTGERMVIGGCSFSHCCWNYWPQINNLTSTLIYYKRWTSSRSSTGLIKYWWVLGEYCILIQYRTYGKLVSIGEYWLSTGPDPVPDWLSIGEYWLSNWSGWGPGSWSCSVKRAEFRVLEQNIPVSIDQWKTAQDSDRNISTSWQIHLPLRSLSLFLLARLWADWPIRNSNSPTNQEMGDVVIYDWIDDRTTTTKIATNQRRRDGQSWNLTGLQWNGGRSWGLRCYNFTKKCYHRGWWVWLNVQQWPPPTWAPPPLAPNVTTYH